MDKSSPAAALGRLTLQDLITSPDPAVRNLSVETIVSSQGPAGLRAELAQLDTFRRRETNLYPRVRALFFLYSLHRFYLPAAGALVPGGLVPQKAHELILDRRFAEAIDILLADSHGAGTTEAASSALAHAYQRLALQTLADQVRRSVRAVRGNQWMFRLGHPADQPLRFRTELLEGSDGVYPILAEATPVRMDLSHSGWSDIFFLGMDFPEGARVLNVSVDLGVHGRDSQPKPPVQAFLRVIDEPVLRLTSVDLGATADLTSLAEVFDFAHDHLGLLKAAVIASGLIPPGLEGASQPLSIVLQKMVGSGRGIELISHVNNIPKGSRLAVSTNLLGSLISVAMRATRQAASLTGPLMEPERRIVLARALLGEWLGGSGGGWQDSGGIWPGIKLITGVPASTEDAEHGISRGRLLPSHHVYPESEISRSARQALEDSLILVHGGMAQNVGPILEMVTEKYLLRSGPEWTARKEALRCLDEILEALKRGDVRSLGAATTRNFTGPIQTIIPWATNAFTEKVIASARQGLGEDFWGFWMLGGMSGGGMGFMVAPHRKKEAQGLLLRWLTDAKLEFETGLPFAMDPVVFDYAINEQGTTATLHPSTADCLPKGYWAIATPRWKRLPNEQLSPGRRFELDRFAPGTLHATSPQTALSSPTSSTASTSPSEDSLSEMLRANGFDSTLHEQIRSDLRTGRIGLAQNRLPFSTRVENASPEDIIDTRNWVKSAAPAEYESAGMAALSNGEVAVVTLAAGAGSRWTQGAGVCKALHPFAPFHGKHRTFLEVHLAKSNRIGSLAGIPLPHIFTTSYLTHGPTTAWLERNLPPESRRLVSLSAGRSVGRRLVPTLRDLRFAWEDMPQQRLDEQQQKFRESLRTAWMAWVRATGEGNDYSENTSLQCLHPIGHFYEVPNLLRNGTLSGLLTRHPRLRYVLLHNIDTLGASADPAILGAHIHSGAAFTFEVIPRHGEDRGGGLARINGNLRIVEGLALPRESDEHNLSYYNSMTTWIHLDHWLTLLGITRADVLAAPREPAIQARIDSSIRSLASRLPTYITLKEAKKRWGIGQEDIHPVAQFEKLWGDLTSLPDVNAKYLLVSRFRGQQLKEPAQLDGWWRDGSAKYVDSLCQWH